MTDKSNLIPFTDQGQISKQDLEVILRVNEKVISVQTIVADQNEEVIGLLTAIRDGQQETAEKIDKLVKQSEETNRDIFKMQVLYVVGLLSLIGNLITIFIKK
jgi:hypothetical protein